MHRLPSGGFGRNVWLDSPLHERRQEWLGNIPLVRTHGLNPTIVRRMKPIEQCPPALRL